MKPTGRILRRSTVLRDEEMIWMEESEKRRLIVETGRKLLERELVARTWGNISIRLDEGSCLITPSGLDYTQMSEADIVRLDIGTGEWEGSHKPSSEKRVHIAAYKCFDDMNFVIHTHQKYATAIGLTGPELLDITDEERARLGGIGFAAYGLSGTKKLSRAITEVFRSGCETVLMIHHGALICGRTKDEAMERAQLLEDICRRSVKGMDAAEDHGIIAIPGGFEDELRERFGEAEIFRSEAVDICAAAGRDINAQIDDMAQMIGKRIPAACSSGEAFELLERYPAVLIKDMGAAVRAASEDDAEAMRLLVDKACVSAIHTRAAGREVRLGALDVALMNYIYRHKYSKKKQEVS